MLHNAIDLLVNYVIQDPLDREIAINYVRDNYREFVKSEFFFSVPFYVLKIVLEKDVDVTYTEISDSILQWLFKNRVPPNEGLHLILETIELHKLTLAYIGKNIEPYIGHLPYYSTLMTLKLQFHAINLILDKRKKLIQNSNKLIFVANHGRGKHSLEILNLSRYSWEFKEIPLLLFPGFSVCLIENYIFFIGGTNENVCNNQMYMFNIRNSKCTKLQRFHHKRSKIAIAVLPSVDCDVIYAIGGHNKNTPMCPTSYVESWDSKTKKWNSVVHLNHTRTCTNAAVLNGKIYVAGGYGSDPSGFEEFDPELAKWTILPQMNEPRRFCTIVVHNEMIFAIGGSNHGTQFLISGVEMYDFRLGRWQCINSLPKPMKGLPCSVGNRLFFFGLETKEPIMLEYMEEDESWKNLVGIFPRKNYIAVLKYSSED